MIVSCYVVLSTSRRGSRIDRVTQRRPWLDANEAMLRLELDVPDELWLAPVITVTVPAEAVTVAVEGEVAVDGDGREE